MKIIICILVIFIFSVECHADIRVLEQLTSKQHAKHKIADVKTVVGRIKKRKFLSKHKNKKHKIVTDNWATHDVKHKEIVTSEELDIRNDLAYLPNQDQPFTGKYLEYHSGSSKEHLKNAKQTQVSGSEFKDSKYIEIVYKDGKKNGPITMWDENGVRIGVIYYKEGKPLE